MATTSRQLNTESQDEGQGQTARASSQTPGRGGAEGVDAPGGERSDGGQLGGLMNLSAEQLARGLGWFSLGLGLAEVLAPRGVGRLAGVRGNAGLIRLLGVREIAHGIGIFSQGRRPAGALWARVVGDAIDLACLGGAFASPRTNKGRLAFATANVLTVTALDLLCAQQLSAGGEGAASGQVHAHKSLVINRPAEELYQYWHDFENLPRFMRHLESVQVTGEGRSRWVAKGPAGTSVSWDAQVTEDRPAEVISWRSLEGSDVDNSGSVRFTRAPGGRGTVVRVDIDYTPPGGVFGAGFAKLFGEEPGQQLDGDLRRFKQLMETGEVVVSDATLRGTGLTDQRPGQPAGEGR